MSGQLSKKTEQ